MDKWLHPRQTEVLSFKSDYQNGTQIYTQVGGV